MNKSLLNARRIRVYPRLIIISYLVLYGFIILTGTGLQDRNGGIIGQDFLCYYSTSTNLLNGIVTANYNWEVLYDLEKKIAGNPNQGILPWRYPPVFFLVVYPLAAFPYLMALTLWLSVTLAGYISVVRKIAPHPYTLGLILAFPGTFQNLINGQNGFLSALLLGQGLLLLNTKPQLAGIVLSFLIYKPHLAFLLIIALVAGRKWTALFTASISASIIVIVTTLLFGPESWHAFFSSLSSASEAIERGYLPWEKLLTVFAGARLLGVDVVYAYTIQALISCFAMIAVFWSWSRQTDPLSFIVLICSIFLATPFGFQYDLAIMGPAIAWYVWDCLIYGWLPGEKLALFIAWTMPAFYIQVALHTHVPFVPIVLLTLLLLVLRRQMASFHLNY